MIDSGRAPSQQESDPLRIQAHASPWGFPWDRIQGALAMGLPLVGRSAAGDSANRSRGAVEGDELRGSIGARLSPHDTRYPALFRRLREARAEPGLSQVDVAERLGLIQPPVSRIESGERTIDPIEFADLCRIYGKGARYFLPDLPM